MKIAFESSTKMILNDNAYSYYFLALLSVFCGASVCLLTYQKDLVGLSIGTLFILGGGFIVFYNKATKIILDKESQKCSFIYSTLLNKKIEEIEMKKIKELSLKQGILPKGYTPPYGYTSQGTYDYDLYFILTDGREIIAHFKRKSVLSFSFTPHQKIIEEVKKIADFIKVDLKFIEPGSILDVFKGKKHEVIIRSKK